MRKKIVAGNWKMNLTFEEALKLVVGIEKYAIENSIQSSQEMIIAPPFVYLDNLCGRLNLIPNIKIAAQNCHYQNNGAFTGEVSALMLNSIGVDYVIVGHSERRLYFKESDEELYQKVEIAIANNLQPIFCCGELESHRDSGNYKKVIANQLKETVFKLEEEDFLKCVIAYEPVWAIGTGKTASPSQAQEIHEFIRGLIQQNYNETTADLTTILYGGSCKPNNAKDLFSQKDVDGGLIGGASLNAEDFISIYKALE